MENTFKVSTRDPTERTDYGTRGEEDIDAAIAYSQGRTGHDRVRRQVESHRRQVAENYVRDNLARTKGAFPNYCRRRYAEQARQLNAQAIFKDEECIGRPHPTYREHPDIPGLQVEDVCTLCVRDQARAILNERGEWVTSEYVRKSGINRGTGAGEEEEEYAQIRTPPTRTMRAMPAPRIQPLAPAIMPPPAAAAGMVMDEHREMVVDEENLHTLQRRRQDLYAQREARRESARRTADSSRPNPQPPQSQTRFGMTIFTNKTPAPQSVFKNNNKKSKKKSKRKSSKKQTKQTKRRNN